MTDTAHDHNTPNTIESILTEVKPESVPIVTVNETCVNSCAEEPVIHEQQAMSETPPLYLVGHNDVDVLHANFKWNVDHDLIVLYNQYLLSILKMLREK